MVDAIDVLLARLATLEDKSYYEILRVPSSSSAAEVKEAFHEFALACHPDRYVEDAPEVGRAASEIFKRGVEAYKVLSRPAWRERYDDGLTQGRLRFVVREVKETPPPPAMRTLEEIARSPRAKEYALKADRLISSGKLEDARISLITALQHDHDNEELRDRLQVLYEALALEPL
jgi:curved DNA-binding protein CbpA